MTFDSPIATIELSRRLTRVSVAYTVARMRVLEERSGNPYGVEIREKEGVTALMARGIPSPFFNRVIGLRDGQQALIAAFDDWFRDNGVAGNFVMTPGDFTPSLAHALSQRGYAQTHFDTMLYGRPQTSYGPVAGVEITEVTSPAVMEEFVDVHQGGWGFPQGQREAARANLRGWLGRPAWRLYLARADGRAAAIGKIFIHDGVGFFADATTLKEFRGRGLQTALLRHRAAVARAAGVDLLFSHAEFGSTSHRNMERLGLRVLHTRSVWTRVETATTG